VREALFAILGELDGAVALDLFAGTGALGIEALSRGAARAVFVERDPRALAALEGNLADLGLRPPRAEIRRRDVPRALRDAREQRETYDLVLVDPPYRGARDWERQLEVALPPLLAPRARVVVESDRREPLRLAIEIELERRYGDTCITIHRQR
jgi:16S rRNA (guanine966-N2)-methyltransferase